MFLREKRYVILKNKDIRNYLNATEKGQLTTILDKINTKRLEAGRGDLVAVVVEDDWPEYEKVWEMIEARCDQNSTVEVASKLL